MKQYTSPVLMALQLVGGDIMSSGNSLQVGEEDGRPDNDISISI